MADRPTSRYRSTRAPSGARFSPTPTDSSATSSTTRTCTASTGTALRARYGKLLDDAVTRWDVNFVLGEFIGELNASHTYRGGGDEEQAPKRSVGMLGVDWELANGAYRIKRIVAGGPWDAAVRSPLDEPGVNVKAGDYVLAVNGLPLEYQGRSVGQLPGAWRQDCRADGQRRPSTDGARQVVVKCLTDESELRFRAWIEERRQIVDKATGGKVGYVYVQSTGVDAQNELMRQFMAQWKKDGLVIDERWNSGGQIPDRFIELLNRPILVYWAVRDGAQPAVAAGLASRAAGDADQRLERIGRRRVPVLLPRGRPRAAHRHAHVGRADRHQRRAGAGRRRQRHRADLPDVRPEGPVVRRRSRRRARHRTVGEDPTALAKGGDPQLDRAIKEVTRSYRQAAGDSGAAGVRASACPEAAD